MKKNKNIISQETWIRLICLSRYQEFLREWLNLYDNYFLMNPPVEKELQNNCFFELVNGLLNKWDYFIRENNLSRDNLQKIIEDYSARLKEGQNG